MKRKEFSRREFLQTNTGLASGVAAVPLVSTFGCAPEDKKPVVRIENDNIGKTPSARLVFACSGAADVGAITDQAARQLAKSGDGKMLCSVGLGGKAEPILEITRAAATILAIDGCPLDCTKRSLAEAGFEECLHLRVTDLGMTRGETEISDANVSKVAAEARRLLQK
ncbi:putative zinc-binding protein [Candidatus Latescibacterota bacterium]